MTWVPRRRKRMPNQPAIQTQPAPLGAWQAVKIHFGKKSGTQLGDLTQRDLRWWKENWQPNSQFCKSKLTETIEHPAVEMPAWIEPASYDEDFGPEPEIEHPASIRPAWSQVVRLADPANCPDCALRAALNAATFDLPKISGVTITGTGEHAGAIGGKLTIEASVESVREFETEFNRKKVVNTMAIFRDGEGRVFKWTSSAMPAEVAEGASVTITGTVKSHGEYEGERFTALTRCKVAGATKLAPAHRLTLFCDAKANTDGFAFCDAAGDVLEYGTLQRGISDLDFWPGYQAEQSNAEVCAALLAFDFARRVKEAAGLACLALDFHFDAQWLKGMVGKAKPLRDFAKKHSLVVKMNWIAGTENPADEWTVASGSKSVADAELVALALPI